MFAGVLVLVLWPLWRVTHVSRTAPCAGGSTGYCCVSAPLPLPPWAGDLLGPQFPPTVLRIYPRDLFQKEPFPHFCGDRRAALSLREPRSSSAAKWTGLNCTSCVVSRHGPPSPAGAILDDNAVPKRVREDATVVQMWFLVIDD